MGDGATDIATWIDRELAGSRFSGERLGNRLRSLVDWLSASIGNPLPLACGDWASTKAAYCLFSKDNVSEDQILAVHFAVAAERIREVDEPILVLPDTTEFIFKRSRPETIGAIGFAPMARGPGGHRIPPTASANSCHGPPRAENSACDERPKVQRLIERPAEDIDPMDSTIAASDPVPWLVG